MTSFFHDVDDDDVAFLKAGIMGDPGTGKTHTATLLAIGLVLHLRKIGLPEGNKPVMMLDTETGRSWVKPMFEEAGIKFQAARSRAFKDLVPAMREAEQNSSILIIDSVTHFWEDLKISYMNVLSAKYRRQVTDLEFRDWNFIKTTWRTFSDFFVTSSLHCILCGRLGWEYEHSEDERGKKTIEKTAVKMQAEKGLGYEPSMLVWLEREMNLQTKIVTRTATVLKDRSRRLDGKQFENPTFETFKPHIDFMALGGTHASTDTGRNSEDIIPDDHGGVPPWESNATNRAIILEKIEAVMVKHYPSTTVADKQAKAALLVKHFATTSWTQVSKQMRLSELTLAFDSLHLDLEKRPSEYDEPPVKPIEEIDELPEFEAPPPKVSVAPLRASPEPAKKADIEPRQTGEKTDIAPVQAVPVPVESPDNVPGDLGVDEEMMEAARKALASRFATCLNQRQVTAVWRRFSPMMDDMNQAQQFELKQMRKATNTRIAKQTEPLQQEAAE